ncbi:MAG TPA: outer membrane lipoprotein chaperone LolA [Woeseiaceae bacterium]|nr:outer membrane lipoprotein chaperone LolA [Woeseiaceae bacterium]
MPLRPDFYRGCLLLAGLLLSAGVLAEADRDRGLQLVNSFLTDVQTLTADFTQTLINPDGEVLETSKGTLAISRPGKFRWVYTEPYEQWLVADGLNIWSYDADLSQVSVKGQAEALTDTPALLLSGTGDVLEQFELTGSNVEGGLTWVRLQPLRGDSGFKRVELAFSGTTITRMVFFDNLEQTTIVTLDKVVENEPVDVTEFDFQVPDDVDVVGTPIRPVSGR